MRRRNGAILAGAGILLVTASGLSYWFNQPAVTRLKAQTNVNGAETPDYATKPYENAYVQMHIPTRFSQKPGAGTPQPPIVVQQLFSAPSSSSLSADQLALTIGKLPANGLKDLSAVQLRARTSTYAELTASWLPVGTTIAFEGTESGYELSVFVAHGTQYAVCVLSGVSDKKAQLTHEMQLIIGSLIWPKP